MRCMAVLRPVFALALEGEPAGARRGGVESVLDHLQLLTVGLTVVLLGAVPGGDDVWVDVTIGEATTATTAAPRVTGRIHRPVDDDAAIVVGRLHSGETHLMARAASIFFSRQPAGSHLQDEHSDDDDDDHDDEEHGDADTNNLPGVERGRPREIANIDGQIRLHSASFVLSQAFILTSVSL